MAAAIHRNVIPYGPGGKYPITKVDGSPWVIVDAWGGGWHCYSPAFPKKRSIANVSAWLKEWVLFWVGVWRGDRLFAPLGTAVGYGIHWVGDSLTHEFSGEEEWAPFPNKRKLAAAYNNPFTKNNTIRIRRATESGSIMQLMEPHYVAASARSMTRLIMADPCEAHIVGDLEYYPDGHRVKGPQVWKDGQFWTSVKIESNAYAPPIR